MNHTEIFESITITYTDKLVQIKTDEHLIQYLNQKGKKDARNLAKHILKQYQKLSGQPLLITEDSLTVEILIHVYLDKISNLLQKSNSILPKELTNQLFSLSKTIKSHTEIIDCGEKSVDSNRHIFDTIAPFCDFLVRFLEK